MSEQEQARIANWQRDIQRTYDSLADAFKLSDEEIKLDKRSEWWKLTASFEDWKFDVQSIATLWRVLSTGIPSSMVNHFCLIGDADGLKVTFDRKNSC